MRVLMWHVDKFKSTITEKGRSKVVERYEDPVVEAENAMVVFAAVEKQDEEDPEVISIRATDSIDSQAELLKVKTIVLHPFAHLFADLANADVAVEVLDMIGDRLSERGYEVKRTPFGWFNELEIKAKGHPVSRVARRITAD